MSRPALAFAHIGDLHVTDAEQPNFVDFLSILVQLETQARGQLDFVVLPGDCADNGRPRQYALIATALRMLSVPVYVIPGDHDMEQGGLAAFYDGLGGERLPHSLRLKGCRCLLLDICGAGSGGPDFRLSEEQFRWLEAQLHEARDAGETPVVFMHSYPADLRGDGEASALTRLFAEHEVALVDMGHTHYNELANDGTTIYAATRSTGQVEEGPVGYSVVTLDQGVVGWRFKALDDPFPFVTITAPADHRLLRAQAPEASEIRARVFGDGPVAAVEVRVGDGAWRPMRRVEQTSDWTAPLGRGEGRLIDIAVRVRTEDGRPAFHAIRAAGPDFVAPRRETTGSDAAAIEPWPENGIGGGQLGPNRNGRKW
jgi:3',5'-cyclic AMP phosphodiesterase CpdA